MTDSATTSAPKVQLQWVDWDDNDGQKGGIGFNRNKEDSTKIDKENFFVAGQGSDGHDLFIARQLSTSTSTSTSSSSSSSADSSTSASTAPVTFQGCAFQSLAAAGEYHPHDNTYCGRLISPTDGSLQVETKGYQVLAAVPAESGSTEQLYQMSWVSWVAGMAIPAGRNPLQVGVSSAGDALYACRASLSADLPQALQMSSSSAVGFYDAYAGKAYIPDGEQVLSPYCFELLIADPCQATPSLQASAQTQVSNGLGAAMSSFADAAYVRVDKTSTTGSATYEGYQQDITGLTNLTFVGGAEFPAAGKNFDLTTQATGFSSDQAGNYLNLAFVADWNQNDVISDDSLVLSFRGTLSGSQLSYADWLNDFLAMPLSVTGLAGQVHMGFYLATLSVFDSISSEIKKRNGDQSKTIYITGHSKGGAMAIIAAYLLANQGYKVSVMTFGAPKAGNTQFCSGYNAHAQILSSVSYIYAADPVPCLPFDAPTQSAFQYVAKKPFGVLENAVSDTAASVTTWLQGSQSGFIKGLVSGFTALTQSINSAETTLEDFVGDMMKPGQSAGDALCGSVGLVLFGMAIMPSDYNRVEAAFADSDLSEIYDPVSGSPISAENLQTLQSQIAGLLTGLHNLQNQPLSSASSWPALVGSVRSKIFVDTGLVPKEQEGNIGVYLALFSLMLLVLFPNLAAWVKARASLLPQLNQHLIPLAEQFNNQFMETVTEILQTPYSHVGKIQFVVPTSGSGSFILNTDLPGEHVAEFLFAACSTEGMATIFANHSYYKSLFTPTTTAS